MKNAKLNCTTLFVKERDHKKGVISNQSKCPQITVSSWSESCGQIVPAPEKTDCPFKLRTQGCHSRITSLFYRLLQNRRPGCELSVRSLETGLTSLVLNYDIE